MTSAGTTWRCPRCGFRPHESDGSQCHQQWCQCAGLTPMVPVSRERRVICDGYVLRIVSEEL